MIDIRPYMIRAWRDWILDNKLTPYIVVNCDFEGVQIPKNLKKQKNLTLNVSDGATKNFELNQESLSFKARFNEVLEVIHLPVLSIIGIYALENNHGMWFNVEISDTNKPDNGFTLSD